MVYTYKAQTLQVISVINWLDTENSNSAKKTGISVGVFLKFFCLTSSLNDMVKFYASTSFILCINRNCTLL